MGAAGGRCGRYGWQLACRAGLSVPARCTFARGFVAVAAVAVDVVATHVGRCKKSEVVVVALMVAHQKKKTREDKVGSCMQQQISSAHPARVCLVETSRQSSGY